MQETPKTTSGTALPENGSSHLDSEEFKPGHERTGAVFWISVAFIAAFVIWASFFTESLSAAATAATDWVTRSVGWGYLVVALALIGLLAYLAFSKYGTIRIGPDSSRPEYPTYAWLAMILSAVMGVGLISYGVAEPISHFMVPPHGLAEPGTEEAAVRALQFSFFDWGIHAWAVFAVFGLAIGYSTHRMGRRGLVSPMLRPVFGDLVDGWFGKFIDVLVIIATLMGTTTSLGLGAAQIDEGLQQVLGVVGGVTFQVVIIVVMTLLFTASAITGVSRGIRYLSQTSMTLAALLLVFVFFAGPTSFITNTFFEALGVYGSEFLSMSLRTPGGPESLQWMQWWTYFMLAWWISWGAFVGVFLAKISRGRTIRGFIIGVLGVPSLVFFVWFAVFGGAAINMDMNGGNIGEVTNENLNNAFFAMLEGLPLVGITSVITIFLVVMFFISGADANTYVLSMMSSNGKLSPKRSVLTVWGALTGMTAVVLLLAGGLQALQQAVLLSAAPFTVVVVLLAISLMRELRKDPSAVAGSTSTADRPPAHSKATPETPHEKEF